MCCSCLNLVCPFHYLFQFPIFAMQGGGYTHGRYSRIIDSIRRHMPDASLSGDAIVGFPGETEEQFQATVDLVREVGFDRVNTAAYSPRPNTPAATWPNQVGYLYETKNAWLPFESICYACSSSINNCHLSFIIITHTNQGSRQRCMLQKNCRRIMAAMQSGVSIAELLKKLSRPISDART